MKKLAALVGLPHEDSIDAIAERALFTLTNGALIKPEFNRMVAKLLKNGEDIAPTITPEKANLIHIAMGISGEVGELVERIGEKDIPKIIDEAGDVEFYIAAMIQAINPNLTFEIVTMHTPTIALSEMVVCAGNISDVIKKHAIFGKPLDTGLIESLITDFAVYLSRLYSSLEISRLDVLRGNMTKLLTGSNARYSSGGYSDEQAQAQNDKK